MKYSGKTIAYYDTNSEDYINGTVGVEFSFVQKKFLSYLKSGAHILDFGCGSGRDAKYFLSKGFEVSALDGSIEMCRFASAFAGIHVAHMNFIDFSEKEKYDGIWACASLLHLKTDELLFVLKNIRAALKDNGIFYSSFKYGDFAGERNGRYFNDMTKEKFAALISSIGASGGLQIIESWISEDLRPERKGEKWLNAICKKM